MCMCMHMYMYISWNPQTAQGTLDGKVVNALLQMKPPSPPQCIQEIRVGYAQIGTCDTYGTYVCVYIYTCVCMHMYRYMYISWNPQAKTAKKAEGTLEGKVGNALLQMKPPSMYSRNKGRLCPNWHM